MLGPARLYAGSVEQGRRREAWYLRLYHEAGERGQGWRVSPQEPGFSRAALLMPARRLDRQVVLIYNAQGRIVIPQLNVGNSGLKAVGSLRYIDGMRVRPSAPSSQQQSPRS